MKHIIKSIEPGSIAFQLGILPGDKLISVNNEQIVDFVDYQALCSSEKMVLEIEHDGIITEYEFEKDDFEPLGIEFENDMLGTTRLCANHCLFCFVDQLPENARDSLKVKDDDWRLSLLMGNYITLTNVSDSELERIIKRKASPLYISVHATDEAVRTRLMGFTPKTDILTSLKRLKEGGIEFNTQVVLCPGINDGKILKKTIEDLADLYPACRSLALVPVGLTKYRKQNSEIRQYTKEEAEAVLSLADEFRKKYLKELGTRFVFPSDEMYLIAQKDLPGDSEYEDYAQIDNGVGLIAQLNYEFEFAYDSIPQKLKKGGKKRIKLAAACGQSAKSCLKRLFDTHEFTDVEVNVYAVPNKYFGSEVTVSGLITGCDLVAHIKNISCDAVLITECMLNSEGDRFLDGMTLSEACRASGKKIIPVGRHGEDLVEAVTKFITAKRG